MPSETFPSFEPNALAGLTLALRLMVSRMDMFRLAGDFSVQYAHNYWDTTGSHSDTWIFRVAPKVRMEEELWRLTLGVAAGVALEHGEATVAFSRMCRPISTLCLKSSPCMPEPMVACTGTLSEIFP